MKRRLMLRSLLVAGPLLASPLVRGNTSPGGADTVLRQPVLAQALLPVGAGDWQAWGSSEVSFLGFRLYRAVLWVAGSDPERAPLALALTYRRDITQERLVTTTLDEMRRLGAPPGALPGWRAALERVLPSVQEGDTITGIHIPGRGASFLHQGRHLADVADPEFSQRFFAIWLDPRTRLPQAREELLRRPARSALTSR